ncbi:Lipopolysaccharide biosynthesis protein, LPS:glycosyltransferase [Selenomonas ruminantium]|uniref:Lipopolysaccharide biosynthesis protein, LPS:glycosyltransferase n=1 Tax=Selenomonas ruminantium TaxID=971 RepID=A0A1I3DQ05_SELRU|nr:glycosyltransferase family 8 protein [Selenomonas ruminantium]SFH88648.1 Lipopolysaccharide biosynthesis protein, LPS:glycosyltransferase [Selenomonas ruminantium]
MIHVCYAVSDKKGNYTKYVGASMCSIFENTKEWVTVHFLHDYTLSTDNRRMLMQLVRSYGQQIVFYDFERLFKKRFEELEANNEWMKSYLKPGVSLAIWYRLVMGEALPNVNRVIYLDADTIVNLDIAELWGEKTGQNGLAAVPDKVIQEGHFSRMVEKGLYPEERYFNSGVLLIDMEKFRQEDQLMERGAEFLKKNELVDYPDQDILNYFMGKDCRLLPDKYNTLVSWEMAQKRENVGECIYHYAGQRYAIDAVNNYHRLFLTYFTKTPWCNADFLGNLARNIHQANRSLMLTYANFIAGMHRIVIGEESEKDKLTKMLMLKEKEKFYTLKDFNKKGLRLEPNEVIIFFIKQEDYEKVKKNLEACGVMEGVHFWNGNILLYRDGSQDAKILRES